MADGFFNISPDVLKRAERAQAECAGFFKTIEETGEYNQQKVLRAFIDNKVSEADFSSSTGYGYGDRGREKLDKIFASVFGAQDAIVRHSFTCGTHTLAVALYGVLRPGDTMLCVTGMPYDTIRPVIGITGEGMGSLKDFGIKFEYIDLTEDGRVNMPAVKEALSSKPAMVYIQRSRGYSLRPSLSVSEIGDIVSLVKSRCDAVVMVDNCYGEFV